jgi:hypothetical protein
VIDESTPSKAAKQVPIMQCRQDEKATRGTRLCTDDDFAAGEKHMEKLLKRDNGLMLFGTSFSLELYRIGPIEFHPRSNGQNG